MPPRRDDLARRLRLLARQMADTAVKLADFDRSEEWLEYAKGLAFFAGETREVALEVSESPELTIH